MITPYLSMSLPDVLITAGSTYASQINQAFLVLDTLVGQGTTPSQININADLPFQNNSAVNVRAVRFTSTGTLAAPADVGVIYNNSGNLYFNNNTGQSVQITSGSAIVAANGNIGGLTNTSASVTFSPVTNAFTFLSSPGNLAILSASSLSLSALALSGALSAAFAWLPNVSMLSASTAFFGTVTQMTASNARIASASFVGTSVLTASQAYLPSVSFISASVLSASNAYIANAFFSASNLPNATLVNTTSLTASSALITNGTVTTLNSTTATIGSATITNANITRLTASGEVVSTALTCSSLITTSYAFFGQQVGGAVTLIPSSTGSNTNQLTCTGDIAAQGGFKHSIGPATYFVNSTTLPTVDQPLFVPLHNSLGQLTVQRWTWVAPFQGSLMAVSAYNLGNSVNTTTTVTVYFNNTTPTGLSMVIPANSSSAYAITFKDTYNFNAGDTISAYVKYGAALTSQSTGLAAYVMVEF